VFDGKVVKKAYVVKDTTKLLGLSKEHTALVAEFEKAEFKAKSVEADQKEAAEVEVKEAKTKMDEKEKEVKAARKEVEEEAAKGYGGINMTKGFVTFKTRRDAELAKMMAYTKDAEEFVVSIPPDPSDIIYKDLTADPTAEKIRSLIGYALIAGVFWAYLPAVVSIAYFTSLETLAEYSSVFASMAESPSTSALWDGLVNALALQLFIAFVPTFFVLIFSNFFVLKAEAWLQHKIQEWYYYFQVIFVLLVTAVGSSLLDTLEELAEDPTSVFALLASTLPLATHFYLNYLPLQWVTHAQNLMRTSNLFKFKAFTVLFGEAAAVKKCEPEDQDYYGLGSRSARFTFMLTLTLSFCSLSPLIIILGFINFWVCRKVYGYLVVFCETKKPDLGGVFYVSQLTHVSQGMFIYIVLMTGVLLERDLSMWPGLIAASGLIFQYMSYTRFKNSFRWESLCFEDLLEFNKTTDSGLEYVQPEMLASK
jgi:ABC-type multidrug transport system fused ATPase/permease subunit